MWQDSSDVITENWNGACRSLLELKRRMFQEIFERKTEAGEIEKFSFLFQTHEPNILRKLQSLSEFSEDCAHQLPKTPVDSEVVPTKLIITELNRTFFGHFRVSSKCSEIFSTSETYDHRAGHLVWAKHSSGNSLKNYKYRVVSRKHL